MQKNSYAFFTAIEKLNGEELANWERIRNESPVKEFNFNISSDSDESSFFRNRKLLLKNEHAQSDQVVILISRKFGIIFCVIELFSYPRRIGMNNHNKFSRRYERVILYFRSRHD